MPFRWSLNPYMGCVHRCTFCYVRHFEQRADRPSDDRYGRSIRDQAERRRGSPARARASVVGAGRGRARHRDRPVPARRGEVPAHAGLPRGARRVVDAVLDRDARTARRARHRRPPAGVGARRRPGLLLSPHARRARLADDRARNRTADEPARGDSPTGCGRRRRRRRHGPDPPWALRRSAATRGGRSRGASGRRTRDLGERRAPAAGRARALPRGARPRLARGGRALRGALRQPCIPERGDDEADPRAGAARDRLRAEPDAAAPTGVGTASARPRSLRPPAGTRRLSAVESPSGR